MNISTFRTPQVLCMADLSECRSLRETRKQLGQAAEWRAELERMKTAAVVGCLHVETKTLRGVLSKIPATILQQVLPSCMIAWMSCLQVTARRFGSTQTPHLAIYSVQPASRSIITAADIVLL